MPREEVYATDAAVPEGYELVGTGLAVVEEERVVEGPVVWLDSPAAVLQFVAGGAAPSSIALSRGGTTSFMAPALACGVLGLLTLQGARESHLGILSREYGIPCIMSVEFRSGVRSARGELIPPDGTILRLDLSTSRGRVLRRVGR